MFRGLVFGALLLAGCQTGEKPPVKIVTMPELPSGYSFSLEVGCVWKQANFSVFNQKTQRLKFKYKECPANKTNQSSYSLKNGNTVVQKETIRYSRLYRNPDASVKDVVMNFSVIYLYKLGPLTEREFVQSHMPEAGQNNDLCTIKEISEDVWVVESKFEITLPNFDDAGIIKIPVDPCGRDSHNEKDTWGGEFFAIKDGMVFQIAGLGLAKYIDLSSITYENKG